MTCAARARSRMPFLEHDGTLRELSLGDTTVGSDDRAAWKIADDHLGGRHFVVNIAADGDARIRPVLSPHVVIVDGAQVPAEGMLLRDGAEIAAGQSRFTYTKDKRAVRPSRIIGAADAFLVSEFE